MSGLDQPPRHVRAHVAETDEPDFHVGVSFPKSLVVTPGIETPRRRIETAAAIPAVTNSRP
jgi:hypothetical protein